MVDISDKTILKSYKKAAIRTIKDLKYDNVYTSKIQKAKTPEEVEKIISKAREAKNDVKR